MLVQHIISQQLLYGWSWPCSKRNFEPAVKQPTWLYMDCRISRPLMHTKELILTADQLCQPERIKLPWQVHRMAFIYAARWCKTVKSGSPIVFLYSHKTVRSLSEILYKKVWCTVQWPLDFQWRSLPRGNKSLTAAPCLFACLFHVPPRWLLKRILPSHPKAHRE